MSDFQTPHYVCDYMVSLLPDNVTTVLEPTPGDGNKVNALLKKSYTVVAPNDFWSINGNFDAVVMNPPFTPMQLGYDILFKTMEMSNVVIALMPWLTIINSEKRTKRLVSFGIEQIIHLPRTVFPGSRVQTCILKLIHGHIGNTTIKLEVAKDAVDHRINTAK